MCTSLAPVIGYENAAAIAKEAYHTEKTVRQVAVSRKLLPEDQLSDLLNPERMT
jgi:fumarate hydratase class II